MSTPAYTPRRTARSEFVAVRGLRYHLHRWGEAGAGAPPLVMLHGWMDVGASFQFVVDALAGERTVVAPDWRGFGRTESLPGTDSYWFPDYLGDLDALLDHLSADAPVDLIGHSMGGNVAMVYAGVRPQRVRRLVNLEGFGLPQTRAAQAPTRYAAWLDELKAPQRLRDYASLDEVAERLRKNNPRLTPERAAWLAPHWARPDAAAGGRWVIQGDPAHKRANPVLYRAEEALACWARITAPVLWAEARQTDVARFWGERYPRDEFEQRLATVPSLERVMVEDAGHMLHHDQPEALARAIDAFLDAA
ncbi:MAG TPA: alpha/beta hydrolase [Methylibium sp.]|nr:alpha/beta hydrolase [Methylibium sp.]